jgi:ketosteroid isomerase-like protein
MKTSLSSIVFLAFLIIAFACQPQPSVLTDTQKAAIADSAKAVAQEVARGVQALNGAAVLARCSSDPDARFLENGFLYASYGAFRDTLYADYATLSPVSYQIDALDVVVLDADAAATTESFHFTVKTKAGEEVKGQGIASFVVQKRQGRWQIIQWHESELNNSELETAEADLPAKQEPAKK